MASTSTSFGNAVERLAVGSERQRPARRRHGVAVVLAARVVPRPRAGGLLLVALRDLPWLREGFVVLDGHLRFDRRVVDLAHARRRATCVAEHEPGAIDDDVVAARAFQADR